jgi:hypothetical protein
VLHPFTAYYAAETGEHVWTTALGTLLGVREGAYLPMSFSPTAFFSSGRPWWSGFGTDWTAAETCLGWTSAEAAEAGVIGNTQYSDERMWNIVDNPCGSVSRQFLCAEQPTP